jgi:hypothetical protein
MTARHALFESRRGTKLTHTKAAVLTFVKGKRERLNFLARPSLKRSAYEPSPEVLDQHQVRARQHLP